MCRNAKCCTSKLTSSGRDRDIRARRSPVHNATPLRVYLATAPAVYAAATDHAPLAPRTRAGEDEFARGHDSTHFHRV